jgi:hypothetical protein
VAGSDRKLWIVVKAKNIMKYIKIITSLLIAIGLLCVLAHKAYKNFVLHKPAASFNLAHPEPSTPKQHATTFVATQGYNFSRMLKLVDQTRHVKEAYHAHFSGRPSRKQKPINVKDVQSLLQDLYRERVRIDRYLWDMKVQFKGQLPYKRAQSLRYYQKVIEDAVRDVENILRRV